MPPHAVHVPVGVARDTRYFLELECLRGIAIALVAIFHADGFVRFPFTNTVGMWPAPPVALILGGHTGVSLFFVLSGFLLSLPFLAEVDGERRVDRRRYYRKRALRILPIYWATIAVALVVVVRTPGDLVRGLGYFVFLNSVPSLVQPIKPFTDVVWSLAAEVQFYLVLPLLPLCLRSRRRAIAVGLLVAGLYGAFLAGAIRPLAARDVLTEGVVGRLPQFGCGIAAAWLYRRRRARGVTAPLLDRGWADLAVVACLVALGLLLRSVVHDGYHGWNAPPWYAWHIPEGLCWATILLVLVEGRLLCRPALVNAPWARLGVLSYSIYLLHVPLFVYSLWAARRVWQLPMGWSVSNVIWLIVATGILVVLSEVTYRLIERPFLVRKANLNVVT